MKVSDYIVRRLEEYKVRDVFLLSGGGMMHLLDSVFRSEKIRCWCNLNEQATTICTGDLVGDRGVRQTGSQEVNITAMMQCVTKYAVTVKDKKEIKYHLDKAIYLATHGRKGTVWVDVPLDVQGAQIEEDELREFDPEEEGLVEHYSVSEQDCDEILAMMREAKRPLILVGKGVQTDRMERQIQELCHQLKLPAVATWRAKMVFAEDDDLYFGHPGSPGPRYANWILQTCDFLLTIGSRLNPGITAFNEPHFACHAKHVIVDIDPNEIKKLNMKFVKSIVCDAATFVPALCERAKGLAPLATENWVKYCREAKAAYPIYREKQSVEQHQTNMYLFGRELSLRTKTEDVIVEGSSGRSCGIIGMSYERREGQVEIGAMGLGSMGFALPASIGACIACGKRRTITLEGDGSLQHNLQELALVRGYDLPLKLFVLNNNGYASIAVMQDNHFKSRYAGCNKDSGVFCCDMKKLAELYGLKYCTIRGDEEIAPVLDEVLADDTPVLCEVFADYTFDEIPKAMTRVNPDGSLSSSVLEDMFPFLPAEETQKWLSIAE